MKQDRLNNYLLVYCHKSITDTLDTVKIACANEQRKWHFEKFEEGCAYVWVEDEPLPPPNTPPPPTVQKRSAASGIICPLTEKSNIMHNLLILITYLLRNLLKFGSIW